MESNFPSMSKTELTNAWMVKHFQVQNSTEPSDLRPSWYRLEVVPKSLESNGEPNKVTPKRKCSSITTSMEVEASDVHSNDFTRCEVGGLRGFVSKIFSRLTPVSNSPEYKKLCRSPGYMSSHVAAAVEPHSTCIHRGAMNRVDCMASKVDGRDTSPPSHSEQKTGSTTLRNTAVSPNPCSSNTNGVVLMEIDEIPSDPFLTPKVCRKAPASMCTKVRSLCNRYETLSLATKTRSSPRVKRIQNHNKKLSHANNLSFENVASSNSFILSSRRRHDTCSLPDFDVYQHAQSGILRQRSSSYSDLSRFERYSNTISSAGMEVFIEEVRKTFHALKIEDKVNVNKVSNCKTDNDLIDFDGTVPTRAYLKEAMSNLKRRMAGSDNQCILGKNILPSYSTKKSTLGKRLKKYLLAASCSSSKGLGASPKHSSIAAWHKLKESTAGCSEGNDPNIQSSTLEDGDSNKFASSSSQSHSISDDMQEETSEIDLTEVSQLSFAWNDKSSILKSPQIQPCKKSVRFSLND